MPASYRIAIAQVSSESNHFVPSVCELEFLRATGYHLEGDDVLKLRGTDGEIGGALALLEAQPDVQLVPILATRGNSSTVLSDACYGYLRQGILRGILEAGPIHGVLLSHHGSMAAVHEDDPEGDIALAVRQLVGPGVPIAMTLDLHGNVTSRMVRACNIITGYEHYPHDDAATTGRRAADLLLRTLRGQINPVMAHARLPMLLTAFLASTSGDGPFAQLMNKAKALEQVPLAGSVRDKSGTASGAAPAAQSTVSSDAYVAREGQNTADSAMGTAPPPGVAVPLPSRNPGVPGILSTSMFFVGSYIDVPDIGCSTLVIADGQATLAERHARDLAGAFAARRREFVTPTHSVIQAVERGRAIAGGPVLLLDTADTTGGGAAGDGIGLVKGLLVAGVSEPCLAMVVDLRAVANCAAVPIGRDVTLALGHQLDPRWGTPLRTTARVLARSDGDFQYSGGILGGTRASMGPSVVLGIGSIRLLVMTRPTYDWAYEQYACAGLDPSQAKFVGVKNMMNFRTGYRDIMKGYFVLDLPGPTPPDMRSLPFRRIPRPMFPFDDAGDPHAVVTVSGALRA